MRRVPIRENESGTNLFADEIGIEIIEILEIISRSHPNRLLLKHYEIFRDLVALANAAVLRLDLMISDRATESNDKVKMVEFVKVSAQCEPFYNNL